ncbi:MAG: cupredoxin domain-containing protein [Betaproteobacteria bacterium]|nr:cupredoxin domain-containing protein [Betaproteobacteria bacterium]
MAWTLRTALRLALGLLLSFAARAAEPPTFVLVMFDGRLQPEVIEVPAKTKFRLEIRNQGKSAAEFESLELRKESVLAPGVTRTLVFAPLQPGSYNFFDEFHPATAQGRIVAK